MPGRPQLVANRTKRIIGALNKSAEPVGLQNFTSHAILSLISDGQFAIAGDDGDMFETGKDAASIVDERA